MLTLMRSVPLPRAPSVGGTPDGRTVRGCTEDDAAALSALCFSSYDPGVACDSPEEATADIAATFAGEYGRLLPSASLLGFTPGGELAAGVLVVERAPWEDTPDCPFVIELFTDRAHRRRGWATALLTGATEVLAHDGRTEVALRVAQDNEPALRLYRELGFSDRADGDDGERRA